MRKIRQNTGIYKYLEETGVLERGIEEEIQQARKNYKKKYILSYKRKQRSQQKEFTVLLNKDEYKSMSAQAKNHHMTVVRFLKLAAIAYTNKKYIVPDREAVARIESTLIQIQNEIQAIAKRNKILFGLNPLAIEKRINRMETVIYDALQNPPSINNPTLQAHSNTHDCEDKDKEKAHIQTTA